MSKLDVLVHGIDLNAPGGLDALLAFHRQQFGDARMEGEGGGETASGGENPAGSGAGGGGAGGGGEGDRGFPEATPVAQMTDAQQAAYWKFHARKHEGRYQALGDVDKLKADAAAFAQHQEATATEHQKEVAKARAEAEAAVVQRMASTLVQQEFRIAAAGKVADDALAAYLEDVDLSKFADKDGKPDLDRIKTSVARLAPQGSSRDGWPAGSFAGGGGGAPTPAGKDAGLAEAQRRFGKKQ